jgi:hypothetical protein
MRSRNGTSAIATLRERVAEEAARMMIEHGIRDFATAKRKAAERLRVNERGALPSNALVEERVAARQRIFEPAGHTERLTTMRRTALRVMDELEDFEPRLVGPVLAGTATINAVIELHVFCDQVELVAATLTDRRYDYRSVERRYRFARSDSVRVPGFKLIADQHEVLIEVFPEDGIRQAPLSPVDQRPMRRASRAVVSKLLSG